MVEAVHCTAAGSVHVAVGLDDDDPADYTAAMDGYTGGEVTFSRGVRRSLSSWTNLLAELVLGEPNAAGAPRYLASLGDDHFPRTPGWDHLLIEAIEQLDGPGMAYGNDLLQGQAMPTAWVVSADVVRALGWMMLPGCAHMYVDNTILTLGKAADRIAYRPDVVIEHVHPLAGKTSWDQSYRESNTSQRYAADKAAFDTWRAEQLAADAATVAALRAQRRR